jgi:hypothetical protein
MKKFTSGPPGGRTLSQTATRLSDLAGGIYGPGASVASTGLNTHRPAIKAGIARAAGETWEDVLEYYLVCRFFVVSLPSPKFNSCTANSSTRSAVRLISPIASVKYSTKAVYTRLLVALLLAAKASVQSPATSNRRVGTSY